MREGWKCPNCGRAHWPHIDTCPGGTGGVEFIPPPAPYPYTPTINTPPFYGATGGYTYPQKYRGNVLTKESIEWQRGTFPSNTGAN